MKITAIIIAKNEENQIKDCLRNLKSLDEIIVIDNNSEDKTAEAAGKFNAKVLSFKKTDFSEMRNFGKKNAKYDWLFYIDADETVSEDLINEIKNLPRDGYSAFKIVRKNYYFKKPWPASEKMVRLIKKNSLIKWYGKIHETPRVSGKIGILKNELHHYTHNSLSEMVKKTNVWSEIEADLRIEDNHPEMRWWRFFRVMLTGFWNSFAVQKGYKVGTVGLIESIYQSFSLFITYAKLWEKQEKKS